MTKVQGSISNGITRTPTGMTAVVVPGSSAPTAYVGQQTMTVASSPPTRMIQNYPTTLHQQQQSTPQQIISFGGQIPMMATAHLSASSILADSRKQSVLMQQQQGSAVPPPTGNVIVVHRGSCLSKHYLYFYFEQWIRLIFHFPMNKSLSNLMCDSNVCLSSHGAFDLSTDLVFLCAL